ncbi:MAG: hypothetical protein ACTTJS_02970 [Wolinella sp.]
MSYFDFLSNSDATFLHEVMIKNTKYRYFLYFYAKKQEKNPGVDSW